MADTWLILALLAVLLYGTSQVAQKVSLFSVSAPQVAFLSIVMAVPISLVCLAPYIWSGDLFRIELGALGIGLAAAAFGQFGYYTYLEAAERGPISIVGSVTAVYPIMVIAVFAIKEAPSSVQLGGVLLVTLAVIALSYSHGRSEETKKHPTRKYFAICIVTVFFWALWAIFTKLSLDRMDALLFLGLYAIVIIPATLIYYAYRGLKIRQVVPAWSVPLMIAIMSSEVGNIAYFCEVNAAAQGPASLVFPLVASSPVIVVLLAYGFLRERLSSLEWLLVALVVGGIIMVSTI
jgi:transporter family protein